MYRSAKYPVDPAAVAMFVAGQRHGTLIATPPGGYPQISILPFVHEGDSIELHCVQEDATFAAVRANPRVTFLVSDFLAFSRHDWVDPEDAGRATLNFRAVAFECEATTDTDPAAVATALARLLAVYEPGADYVPIAADNPLYGLRVERLAVIRLRIIHTEAKFKVGPAAPVAVKRRVVAGLRERNEPGDARAADEIEATLPRE
jgi:predicted FMN-binding regulatory protein PaiB